MNRLARLWKRFRKKKEPPTLPKKELELREFVYLDDVSVDSLVASVRGSILDQVTHTRGLQVESEVGTTIGGSVPLTKAELTARLQTTTSEGLQTLRRAEIQARFGELLQIVDRRRVLRPDEDAPPKIESILDVQKLAAGPTGSQWAVRLEDLCRGAVIEIDVEIGAEPLFRLVSAISQIVDLLPENLDLAGLAVLPNVGQVKEVSKMLSRMLGGLVPIRSRAIHFEVIDVDGEKWLLHHKVLDQLASYPIGERRALEVVAVAAEDRFWKDQRRILFDGARYRILARIRVDGITSSWTPVKMVDALKDLVPGFGDAINDLSRTGKGLFVVPMTAKSQEHQIGAGSTSKSRGQLLVELYCKLLSDHIGVPVSDSDLVEVGLTTDVDSDLPSVEDLRVYLGPAIEYLQSLTPAPIDPTVISEKRYAALCGIERNRKGTDSVLRVRGVPQAENLSEPALLEVELVAIYW